MPTPKGLPKAGEVWVWHQPKTGNRRKQDVEFQVLSRGGGVYWSLGIRVLSINGEAANQHEGRTRTWVDASYFHQQGQFEYKRGSA